MILRIIIMCLAVYVFFLIPEKFLNLYYFKINKINIVNNSKMLRSELTNLTKKIYNKNSTKLNYKSLEDFYKKDLRIKNLKIEDKKLGEIDIIAQGEDLSYYTIINNKVFLVNDRGEIFAYLNEKNREFLPFIMAKNKKERLELIEILNRFENLDIIRYVSQISKLSKNEYKIIFLDGTKLRVNLDTNKGKYKVAEKLYFNIRETKKIDYIDLRFDDYIIKYLGDENEK